MRSFHLFQVELAEGMQTLFRSNSLASKAMAFAFKIYGSNYLHQLLAPSMAIMVHESDNSYEVDPTRFVIRLILFVLSRIRILAHF